MQWVGILITVLVAMKTAQPASQVIDHNFPLWYAKMQSFKLNVTPPPQPFMQTSELSVTQSLQPLMFPSSSSSPSSIPPALLFPQAPSPAAFPSSSPPPPGDQTSKNQTLVSTSDRIPIIGGDFTRGVVCAGLCQVKVSTWSCSTDWDCINRITGA